MFSQQPLSTALACPPETPRGVDHLAGVARALAQPDRRERGDLCLQCNMIDFRCWRRLGTTLQAKKMDVFEA